MNPLLLIKLIVENVKLKQKIESIKDSKYKHEAYFFVLGGINFTREKIGEARHITGEELCLGLKELITSEFGPTSEIVLNHWGIKSTNDFGEIVYKLIEAGVLGKTEDDKIEDFDNVFKFSALKKIKIKELASNE